MGPPLTARLARRRYLRVQHDGCDLAHRYRLVRGAYPDVVIDETRLPADLRALVPLAKRYGHGNPVLLADCVAKMKPSERAEIVANIDAHRSAIEKWIAQNPRIQFADEVSAFQQLLELRSILRPATTSSDSAG